MNLLFCNDVIYDHFCFCEEMKTSNLKQKKKRMSKIQKKLKKKIKNKNKTEKHKKNWHSNNDDRSNANHKLSLLPRHKM